MGKCPECGEWNTMAEESEAPKKKGRRSSLNQDPQPINQINLAPEMRLATGINEFDRTLGGGLVPGSLTLIGGDPGIGKSTLVLQVLDRISQKGIRCIYLSGEESALQIRLRADRLSVSAPALHVMTGTCVEEILDMVRTFKPGLLAVDSIQTMYTEDVPSAPGSVGQVREAASRFMAYAKQTGVPVFLVGHVTKEGAIAGPKLLEHLVDTVLYFEGDTGHVFRILRAVKNRYGSTNEIGVFEMKDAGLAEVLNPSRILLEERPGGVSGSVVTPCLEGTRPLLLEIQALVGSSAIGIPRRTAVGVDHNRISLLVAVLGKRLEMQLGDQDIFVNVAGGLKVDEPAADLAIVSAMMSSYLNKPLERDVVVFGEVGLAGEIRGVSQPDLRVREAKKLGFKRCIMPKSNAEGRGDFVKDISIEGTASLQDLYRIVF
jgi:DNA repair protein RadA/Sms